MIEDPCIFLPGTLCDERIFSKMWPHLNLENRLFVPLQWADNLQQMQALTNDRLESCHSPAHLIGYSMGGYVAALSAINCAINNPKKVKSLTLISYDPFGLSKLETQARQLVVKMLKQNPNLNLGEKRLENYFTSGELKQETYKNIVLAMEQDLGTRTLLNQIQSTTPREDLSGALLKTNIPILLLVGSEDKIASPDNIQKFAKAHSRGNAQVFDNTSHMLPITRGLDLSVKIEEFISQF